MPIETDFTNLIKHIQDASDGLEGKIKSTGEELAILTNLQSRREDLVGKINDLGIEVDDYMDDVGSVI